MASHELFDGIGPWRTPVVAARDIYGGAARALTHYCIQGSQGSPLRILVPPPQGLVESTPTSLARLQLDWFQPCLFPALHNPTMADEMTGLCGTIVLLDKPTYNTQAKCSKSKLG